MLCQCPKLTPLQSRFVASFATLVILGLIWLSLSNPHFAYATELGRDGSGQVSGGADHNWHRIHEVDAGEDGMQVANLGGTSSELRWEGDGEGSKGVVQRVDQTPQTIAANDSPNNLNIVPGQTTVWKYRKQLLTGPHTDKGTGLPSELSASVGHQELRKRSNDDSVDGAGNLFTRQGSGDTRRVYISANTCLQPSYNGTGTQTAAPPQLTVYVAMNTALTDPGPNADPAQQTALPLRQGYLNHLVTANTDLYIAIHAPQLPNGFTGGWNYDLAVSIDDFYHQANATSPLLFLVDVDTSAALLVTDNLTQADNGSQIYQQWLNLSSPFVMFANQLNDTSTMGVERSYCGLQNSAKIQASQSDPEGTISHVQMGMITRGLGDKPKEQFYITSLNGSSAYQGFLAMDGNSTNSGAGVVGGGGKVWAPVLWTTKADSNCALLFNLSFCSEVAYAVPSNPNNFPDVRSLAALYDHNAGELYKNFSYSLQQIPCATTNDAQYSLARNCDDCADAYKQWLCAVTIPRCEDFSNPATYLQPRNVGQAFISNQSTLSSGHLDQQFVPMSNAPTLDGSPAFQQTYTSSLATNSSRNLTIDQLVMPGPYKEVLPCEDLCYSLMQSCPAALGFGCPLPGLGLEVSYGKRTAFGRNLTCSYLGAVYYLNGAGSLIPAVMTATAFAVLAGLLLV